MDHALRSVKLGVVEICTKNPQIVQNLFTTMRAIFLQIMRPMSTSRIIFFRTPENTEIEKCQVT